MDSNPTLTSALERLWRAGLAEADPLEPTAAALPSRSAGGRTVILGAGKAAARMAEAAERIYGAEAEGLVVVPKGYGARLNWIEIVEAAHPIPDAAGQAAAIRALATAAALGAEDRLIVLLSGGASALWAAPPEGVSLAEKQALSRDLLKSGATIQEINTVRKHLSRLKGGRLAAAAFPCPVLTLAVSDVPGDDPSAIGSGPTVGDPTTLEDARAVLGRYGIAPSPAVAAALSDAANESPEPDDPQLARSCYRLVLTPRRMIEAVAEEARALGYEPVVLGSELQGEAREAAIEHAKLVREAARRGRRAAFISGGELDVTGAADGPGGRCREYLLALAVALDGEAGVSAAALDTDGIDGSGGQAGAVIGPDTLGRARAAGLDAAALLDRHVSGEFFEALGDHIVTGPTRTNLSDLRIILTGAQSS
jgi:hydroxypyruvate reductase